MIALRLRKRRDGSLCLTDAAGSVSNPDRAFPEQHGFTYEWLAGNGDVAMLRGDTLTLTLANATATYRVTERRSDGFDVELVDSSLSDPPPVDEAKAAGIAARDADMGWTSVEQGFAGSLRVEEG